MHQVNGGKFKFDRTRVTIMTVPVAIFQTLISYIAEFIHKKKLHSRCCIVRTIIVIYIFQLWVSHITLSICSNLIIDCHYAPTKRRNNEFHLFWSDSWVWWSLLLTYWRLCIMLVHICGSSDYCAKSPFERIMLLKRVWNSFNETMYLSSQIQQSITYSTNANQESTSSKEYTGIIIWFLLFLKRFAEFINNLHTWVFPHLFL